MDSKIDPLVYLVQVGTDTTDNLVERLKKRRFNVNRLINQANFPAVSEKPAEHRVVVFDDPGIDSATPKSIFHILRYYGLECPTYEHPIQFALQYGMTTDLKRPLVIFPHSPCICGGYARNIYVCIESGHRELELRNLKFGLSRSRCLLAGILPAGKP